MSYLNNSDINRIVRKVLLESVTIEDYSDPLIDSIMDRVIEHEGKKEMVYKDSRGIPTIGVGFNLNRGDSSELLKQVGANPKKIRSGVEKLNDKQIKKLLKHNLKEAKQNTRDLVKNFNSLPENVQGVLVEMTFNLGKEGLSGFKNFLKHINNKDWVKASKEMLNSTWAKQVGNRSVVLSNIIKSTKPTNNSFTYNPEDMKYVDTWMGKQFDRRTGMEIGDKLSNLTSKK